MTKIMTIGQTPAGTKKNRRAMTNGGKFARFALALGVILLALVSGAAVSPAWAVASEWDQTDVSEVRLVAATDGVGDGETVKLALQFRMNPGWKIYWRSPGDAGLPPQPDFSESTNLAATSMAWPAPQRFLEEGDLETIGYLDEAVFPIEAALAEPGAPVSVRAVIDYQACEKICIPFAAEVALDLPAGPATPNAYTQLLDRAEAMVPGAPQTAGMTIETVALEGTVPNQEIKLAVVGTYPFTAPDLLVEGGNLYRFTKAAARLSEDRLRAELTVPVESFSKEDATGQALTLTLVDQAMAAEFKVVLGEAHAATPAADTAMSTTGSTTGSPAGSSGDTGSVTGAATGASFALILALALIGGLILNLMPCVLPVLSLKLMGLISHGGGERGPVVRSFLATSAGIIASFLVLAVALIGLKAGGHAVGWGIQFQQPLFLVFLTIVVSLFAYNLFGLFEIRLPGAVGDIAAATGQGHGGSSLSGAFWTGAFATLLATPCSAPFLGTAIGFALSGGTIDILAVFFALGVGMALPYLLVAAVPRLATCLPRPGAWMVWVKRVMGLALVATAIWLISVIAVQTGLTAALAVGAAMIAIGLALGLLLRDGRRGMAAGAAGALAVLAFVVPSLLGTAPMPPMPVAGDPAAGDPGVVTWQAFDPAAIPQLVADGRTVFVDVTADWCITCKVNKRAVLDSAAITDLLQAADIVAMRADWTRPNPAIAEYLASFGRYGIPFNVVYGPAHPDGVILSELLSQTAVLDAFSQAKGS